MTKDQQFKLYISGGWHLTDTDSRIDGLPIKPESFDVVFEENATHNPPSGLSILTNWAVTPLICLFLKLYLIMLNGASRIGLTDSSVVDIIRNAGAQNIQTDRNYHRMLASERRFWGLGHWAFVSMIFFGISEWFQFITPILSFLVNPLIEVVPSRLQSTVVIGALGFGLVLWFLLAGALMGWFFIVGTTETRNYAIIQHIECHVQENCHHTIGCLVVGAAHVPHLIELINESEYLELEDGR